MLNEFEVTDAVPSPSYEIDGVNSPPYPAFSGMLARVIVGNLFDAVPLSGIDWLAETTLSALSVNTKDSLRGSPATVGANSMLRLQTAPGVTDPLEAQSAG